MKQYRIAVERIYSDVSVQFIEAESLVEAKTKALDKARHNDPVRDKDFSLSSRCRIIEAWEEK